MLIVFLTRCARIRLRQVEHCRKESGCPYRNRITVYETLGICFDPKTGLIKSFYLSLSVCSYGGDRFEDSIKIDPPPPNSSSTLKQAITVVRPAENTRTHAPTLLPGVMRRLHGEGDQRLPPYYRLFSRRELFVSTRSRNKQA